MCIRDRRTGLRPVGRNSRIRRASDQLRHCGKGHTPKIAGHIRASAHTGFKIALGHKLAEHVGHGAACKLQLARQNTAGGQPVARTKLSGFDGFPQTGGQLTAHAARLERQTAQSRQFGCDTLFPHNGPIAFLLMVLYHSPIWP